MKKLIIISLILLALGCAHTPDSINVQEKLYQYEDVDDFVTWLKAQPRIRWVEVNKWLFLTSSPPKVIVTYYEKMSRKKLLIAVEPDKKLKLVDPEFD